MFHSPTRFLELRGQDSTGNGWFGASRGKRLHKGCDYMAVPGEEIFAIMPGKVTKLGYVYRQTKPGKPTMRFVEIQKVIAGSHYKVWQMYVGEFDVKVGDTVEANEFIGYAQDIAGYHDLEDMKNHVHVQIWKNGLLTDPEPLIVDTSKIYI